MDSDPLKHLEFFSVPNNQTLNPLDQPFVLPGNSTQPLSIWDTAASNLDVGLSGPPSTAPTAMSLESLAQGSATTGLTSLSPNPAMASRQSIYGGQPRPGLPTRTHGLGDRHERKRSKLGTDPAPFDSVDYWMQFDDDLADIPEGIEAPRPSVKEKGKGLSTHRQAGSAPRRVNSASSSRKASRMKTEDFVDDSALDNALSEDEDEGFSSINIADHLSKIDSAPPTDVPPREGLYSTPLSWERPQPGLRMDSLIGLNSPALNEAEQRRLIAIAMNPGPSMGGLGSSLNFNFNGMSSGLDTTLGQGFGDSRMSHEPHTVSPPRQPGAQPQARPPPPFAPSRQNSMASDRGKDKPKPGDRTAHNDIERKYRTNLKDRIAELRDAVPSLHTIAENGGDDEGSQPSRTPKVSKGTVLTKATEYIHYLERRNKQIAQEHLDLSRRLQAFEQLLHASTRAYQMPSYSRTLFDPRGFC
ncbi:helix-loop-helix DNA-binding domain-containing protein [Podospora didyma]|uniref:Helix-loop-helix DNA-binding domain-containing protein n=1 Tax=Podospora didyma TaxID=330526 RepID=A0AAE0TVX7_9PEZI|nr:helix-loop-helix DNA-binding domain-containing protein [Podospora didyma]